MFVQTVYFFSVCRVYYIITFDGKLMISVCEILTGHFGTIRCLSLPIEMLLVNIFLRNLIHSLSFFPVIEMNLSCNFAVERRFWRQYSPLSTLVLLCPYVEYLVSQVFDSDSSNEGEFKMDATLVLCCHSIYVTIIISSSNKVVMLY